MERWDGTVLNINATCADLGPKCLQLLGMHALSGCDTTSYPYSKGKISALKTLLADNFPDMLGEVGTTHANLTAATKPFFAALYRQPQGTSMECTIQTFHQEEEKSQSDGPTSDICQPVAACVASSSANYVVESSRPTRTS